MPNRNRNTEREVIDVLIRLKRASTKRIASELNLSHKWIEDKIRVLKDAERIYIIDWEKHAVAGDYRKVWALGNEPDEPKPPPRSNTQKSTDYRKRKRAKELNSWIPKTSDNPPSQPVMQ